MKILEIIRVTLVTSGIVFGCIVLFFIVFAGLVGKAFTENYDLGEGFQYVQDYPQGIIWKDPKMISGSQETILEGFVTKFAYDTHSLLLQTRGIDWRQVNADTTSTYWIIEKSTRKKSSYKTRKDLEIALFNLGIELELQDFPYYGYSNTMGQKKN